MKISISMRLLILALPFLWLATPVLSQPVDPARLVERMLDTGADGSALADLARAPAQAEMVDALGPERSEILREAWSRAFALSDLRGDVVGFLAGRERPADLTTGLEWLRRSDVARATASMRQATGHEFDREFGQWLASVVEDDLDLERLRTIVQISERSGEDRVGEVVLSLAEASVRGAYAVAPRGDRPSLEDALRRLHDLGPTLTAQAVVQNQLYLYYVLSELTLQELRAYASALDEPAGQWYVSAMGDAIAHAIERSNRRLVREVEALTPRR